MNNSIRYLILIALPLMVAIAFNNCSQVQFSKDGSNQVQCVAPCSQPSPNPSGSPSPTPTPSPSPSVPGQVTLSPYINSVAFEDLYYVPGTTPSETPDFDYNDFMTEFRIQEVTNKKNQITDIYVDFYPRAVGAGYDHIFYLILTGKKTTVSKNSASLPITKPMFNGAATVTLSYYDAKGALKSGPTATPYNQDVEIFSSTHAVFDNSTSQINTILPSGYMSGIPGNYVEAQTNARVHIQLTNPELNIATATSTIDPSTFRVILHPKPTDLDIDIINVDPKNFVGSTGYPWGFIIPTAWQWMTEFNDIDKGYPEFAQYRNYLEGKPATGDYMNWFNYPGTTDPKIIYPKIPLSETMPPL